MESGALRVLEPWDQQPGEGSRAFAGFKVYRDMGPQRSLVKAFKEMTGKDKSRGKFDIWSMQNDWVNRCEMYDRNVDQLGTIEKMKVVREMAERHATMASVFLNKVVQRLQTIDANVLTPDQLLKWFDACTRIERLSRGESTENVSNKHSGTVTNKIDLSGISDDDFDAIHTIIVRSTNTGSIEGGAGPKKKEQLPEICTGFLSTV